MVNMRITGLEKLQKDLKDAKRAAKALDGTIATIEFNPDDPQSVKDAIRRMESAIDSKTATYRGNALVSDLVKELKEKYRKGIIGRARSSGHKTPR